MADQEQTEKKEEKPTPQPTPQATPTPAPAPAPKKSTWALIKEKAGAAVSKIRDRPPVIPPKESKLYHLQKYKEKRWEERRKELKEKETIATAQLKERAKETALRTKERIEKKGIEAGKYVKGSTVYAGAQVGAQETKEKFKQTMYRAGKETGRLPVTLAKAGYGVAKGRYAAMRESIRTTPQKGWHSGLLWSPGAGTPTRGGIAGRIASGGGYYPRPTGRGRMPRSRIPRGLIKPYWSKKLKKMARTNIRRYGAEEGMTKTRTVAQMLGWKMQ